MQASAERYITEEEYWTLELDSPVKHEYFDGRIYAMAGASTAHNTLSANALIAIGSQLLDSPCRILGSDQRLKIEATGLITYPDAVVLCEAARFDSNNSDTLLEPKVLIEVLSPSTADYDRGKKFDHYKQLESLCDYLLVSQDRVRIDHFHRLDTGDWLLHTATTLDDAIGLESINSSLSLRDVYRRVTFSAEARPLRDVVNDEETS